MKKIVNSNNKTIDNTKAINKSIKKEGVIPPVLIDTNKLIYSSGIKVGIPSAEATETHITAEELPLLAIV